MGKQAVEIALAAIDGKAAADKNILVPVLGLTRTDPDGVKKFLAMLKTFQ